MNEHEPITFSSSKIVPKGWGSEQHVINNSLYCGKLLRFDAGKRFSMHFHRKTETWCVLSGRLELHFFNLECAEKLVRVIGEGDVVHVPPGNPHQLVALEDSVVMEVSTTDYSWDNYRIGKGDSQK